MASSSSSSSHLRIDPPTRLIAGSADDSVAARQNFIDRERASRDVLSFLPFRKKRATPLTRRHSPPRYSTSQDDLPRSPQDTGPLEPSTAFDSLAVVARDRPNEVQLDDQHTASNKNTTLYRWAYVYENQRGTTLFRTFRFSSNALFSFDPPPFSMLQPFSSNEWEKQPLLALDEYPLPDGSWCWLSAEWMIDMRDGNVQHDGFEYNWSFGGKKWRSRAGRFNSRALVRRRRWARLMIRPVGGLESFANDQKANSGTKEVSRGSPSSGGIVAWDAIWKGDGDDWSRCHAAIRSQDGDGRKLELWEDWIEQRPIDKTKVQRKQWTEDAEPLPSEVARDKHVETRLVERSARSPPGAISGVLRRHGVEILYTFIYPSSRTRFLQLLAMSGLIPELRTDEVSNSLQFWDRIKEFSSELAVVNNG